MFRRGSKKRGTNEDYEEMYDGPVDVDEVASSGEFGVTSSANTSSTSGGAEVMEFDIATALQFGASASSDENKESSIFDESARNAAEAHPFRSNNSSPSGGSSTLLRGTFETSTSLFRGTFEAGNDDLSPKVVQLDYSDGRVIGVSSKQSTEELGNGLDGFDVEKSKFEEDGGSDASAEKIPPKSEQFRSPRFKKNAWIYIVILLLLIATCAVVIAVVAVNQQKGDSVDEEAPAPSPTLFFTRSPSTGPTESPTTSPTIFLLPTLAPTQGSLGPTAAPTVSRTDQPSSSLRPTIAASRAPTASPSMMASENPTGQIPETQAPSSSPTAVSSREPSSAPTATPSASPTVCEDDPNARFNINGEIRDCVWINEQPDSAIFLLCRGSISSDCRATCGVCS